RPEAGRVLGNKAQIQLSAGSLTLNDVPATNVLIEGSIDHDQVMLNTVGADMARGALTGVARRNADGSWVVENLRLN
ncbi:AsmA family protein, partial [Salmonella enterica]